MKRVLYVMAVLALVAIVGCEDSPSDPTNQPIVGEWNATRIGSGFSGASTLELHFESGSQMHGSLNGTAIAGTYSTSGSSSSSTVRNITMSIASPMTMDLTGIYEIQSSKLMLEVVPAGSTTITPPDAAIGIGSTKINGTSVGNQYVSELSKQ